MVIESVNIVATAATLPTASERSVAAVTDAYRARLEDYLASMLQAKRSPLRPSSPEVAKEKR